MTPLHTAAEFGCLEAAQVLLEARADVNRVVSGDSTPFSFAAESLAAP